ncbi:MAG: hypothetical protein ACE1ZB_03290, partial [Gammaproteobacteria bacterium]
ARRPVPRLHIARWSNPAKPSWALKFMVSGAGLNLTPYYSHSLAINLDESLSNSVFQDILQMTAHAQRR